MASPKFLENIVILCFERRFFKQNSIIRLQSNILPHPKFFAPPQYLGWLRHGRQAQYKNLLLKAILISSPSCNMSYMNKPISTLFVHAGKFSCNQICVLVLG